MNRNRITLFIFLLVAILALVLFVFLFIHTTGVGRAISITPQPAAMPPHRNRPPQPFFSLVGIKELTLYQGAFAPLLIGDLSGEHDIASVTLLLNNNPVTVEGLTTSGINVLGIEVTNWKWEEPSTKIARDGTNTFTLIMQDTSGQVSTVSVPLVIHTISKTATSQITGGMILGDTITETPIPSPSPSQTPTETSTSTPSPTPTPTPTPKPKCKCIKMDVKSTGTVDGNLNPGQAGNKDPKKLGPITRTDIPEIYRVGYAFEVSAEVEGDPDKCHEHQEVQSTFEYSNHKPEYSSSSGINVWSADGDSGYENPNGEWAPDDYTKPRQATADGTLFVFKEHAGNAIRWFDGPGIFAEIDDIPLKAQYAFKSHVDNSDWSEGCTCNFEVAMEIYNKKGEMNARLFYKHCRS